MSYGTSFNRRSLASCQVLCSLLDVSHGDFGYLERQGLFFAPVSILRNLRANPQSWPVGRLASAEGGLKRLAYCCKVTVGLDPVTGDTLGHGKHGAVGTVTGRPYGVLSSSLAGTDGRIVAKVALDVGDNDMTVDAISRHKPLTSDVAIRHGARRAQRACVGGSGGESMGKRAGG